MRMGREEYIGTVLINIIMDFVNNLNTWRRLLALIIILCEKKAGKHVVLRRGYYLFKYYGQGSQKRNMYLMSYSYLNTTKRPVVPATRWTVHSCYYAMCYRQFNIEYH